MAVVYEGIGALMSELWMIPIAFAVMGLLGWAEKAWLDYQLRQAVKNARLRDDRAANKAKLKLLMGGSDNVLTKPRMRRDFDGMWRCWSPSWTTWEHAEIAQLACSAKIAYLNWRSYYLERHP